MNNEREQNRQRKLNALTGREWDSQKQDENYNQRGGGSQFRRGMHGGVSGYVRRDFDEGRLDDTSATHLSPGYRGRGRGGRGGRGRALSSESWRDRSSSNEPSEQKATSPVSTGVNNETEVPALSAEAESPEDAATETSSRSADKSGSLSPMSDTWAGQVERKRK